MIHQTKHGYNYHLRAKIKPFRMLVGTEYILRVASPLEEVQQGNVLNCISVTTPIKQSPNKEDLKQWKMGYWQVEHELAQELGRKRPQIVRMINLPVLAKQLGKIQAWALDHRQNWVRGWITRVAASMAATLNGPQPTKVERNLW